MKRMHVFTAIGAAVVAAVPSMAHAADQGTLRFLHASPNAPAVDIYVNGTKTVPRLGRGRITPYLELSPGSYSYAVRPAGAPVRTANVLLAGRVQVVKDRVATVAVTNRAGNRDRVRVTVFPDTGVRPFGVAKLRVAHLAFDAPAVDVVARGGKKVVSNLRVNRVTPYLNLPAGTYTLDVRPVGTKVNVLTLRNVRVEAGKVYTAWAVGALKPRHGELGFRGVVTQDRLPARYARTQLRVLHASPGAPNVDVYVNGQKAVPSLPFGVAAPDDGTYLSLPSGTAAVAIRPAGAPESSAPVFAANLELPQQATVTAAARGQLAAGTFTVSPFVDDVSPTDGKARVAVVHLSPNTPAVDVYANAANTTGAAAISGLAFPGASGGLAIPAGTYTFGVTVSGSKAVALPVGPAALPAGSASVVYAIGLLGGTPALSGKVLTTSLP